MEGQGRWWVLGSAALLGGATFGGCMTDSCFHESQPVDTPFGPTPIGRLRPGDPVLAFDDATGLIVTRPVLATRHVTGVPLGAVDLDGGRRLLATATHPFFRPDRQAYEPAGTLDGTTRVLRQGRAVGARFAELARRGTVVDLTVASTHNFLVDGAVVHNKTTIIDCVDQTVPVSCDVRQTVAAPAEGAVRVIDGFVSFDRFYSGQPLVEAGAAGAAGAAGLDGNRSTAGGSYLFYLDNQSQPAPAFGAMGVLMDLEATTAAQRTTLTGWASVVPVAIDCEGHPLGSVDVPSSGKVCFQPVDGILPYYRLDFDGARVRTFQRVGTCPDDATVVAATLDPDDGTCRWR